MTKRTPVYIGSQYVREVTVNQSPREIGGKVLPRRPNVSRVIKGELKHFGVIATAVRISHRGETVWAAQYMEEAS